MDISRITVSSADLVRNFARFRDEAARQPVYVTHHGRETHVLSSVVRFEARGLNAPDPDDGLDEKADRMAFGLADWVDEALIICDRDLCVLYANRVALAMLHCDIAVVLGKQLFEAVPGMEGSLIEVHARRTVTGGEPSAADIPSPFLENAWLRFESFALGERILLKFRDITEDVNRHRLADVKATILKAMSTHGDIGYVRVSVRGSIERVDDPFCEVLDLPEDRLLGVQLADLVAMQDRPAFREKLEMVLRDGGACGLFTRFLSNAGTLLRMKVAMVELRGAYGAEGAVLLLTPAPEADESSQVSAA